MEFRMMVFLNFLFLVGIYETRACREAERMGLLEFKEYLRSEGYSADYLLPSWEDDPKSECCEWERVSCDRTTGRVTELSLYNIRNLNDLRAENAWIFNLSIFHHFDELLLLNLSNNQLVNFKGNLLRLEKLETLDLSWNYFDESIIPSLKGLSFLKNLQLWQNQLSQFPLKDLSSFGQLEKLNLRGCRLDGSVDDEGSGRYSRLSKLKQLDLSFNRITHDIFAILDRTVLPALEVLYLQQNNLRSISSRFGALTTLKVLSLSRNYELKDTAIPALCGLKMLEELDLSKNSFTRIPPCLHNLTSIKLLDLSKNDMAGQAPSSWIARLTSLQYIDIGDNNFDGLFSFSAFNNHSQLELVRLGNNNADFRVETEDSRWIPNFQLKFLVLPNCNLNIFSRKLPEFLLLQTQLRALDLSNNNLAGEFPSWLLINNSRMEILSVRNNSFAGEFYLPPDPLADLISFDISKNQLSGKIPENIGKILPNLKLLKLSRNAFEGNLPPSVGLIGELKMLDLSSNNFSGEVPETLYNCTKLIVLKLSYNGFSGEFFSNRYNWSRLNVLQLNNNFFNGSLWNAEANSNDLLALDISFNMISGTVPTWFAGFGMYILDLSHNSLEGEVPCEIFGAEHVYLSNNMLSGNIPSCSTMEFLEEVHLQSNRFNGTIPTALLKSRHLVVLNLRDNQLSGNIPKTIGKLPSLEFILLGANRFSGFIPKILCALKHLSMLDLSHNALSGKIPQCLRNISFRGGSGAIFENEFSLSVEAPPLGLAYRVKKYSMDVVDLWQVFEIETRANFLTKNRYNSYKGDILFFMSGLDLSDNALEGEIPTELGNLSQIRAINVSHNLLTGSIPSSFGSLTQIESLDLSHNELTGEIPSELAQLTFMGVFSVAYNNLSGRIPYGKAQFGTFDSSSYEGNAYLCGKPLDRNCSGDNNVRPSLPDNDKEHWYDIDLVTFFASFSASFVISCSGVAAFLYVNPYWRQCLFYYGEKIVLSWYYFVSDTVFVLSLRFRLWLRELVSM